MEFQIHSIYTEEYSFSRVLFERCRDRQGYQECHYTTIIQITNDTTVLVQGTLSAEEEENNW